jgi:hypothetical protein
MASGFILTPTTPARLFGQNSIISKEPQSTPWLCLLTNHSSMPAKPLSLVKMTLVTCFQKTINWAF